MLLHKKNVEASDDSSDKFGVKSGDWGKELKYCTCTSVSHWLSLKLQNKHGKNLQIITILKLTH